MKKNSLGHLVSAAILGILYGEGHEIIKYHIPVSWVPHFLIKNTQMIAFVNFLRGK